MTVERRDPDTGKRYVVERKFDTQQLVSSPIPVATLLDALLNHMRRQLDAKQTAETK